jgi:hypothetical protein
MTRSPARGRVPAARGTPPAASRQPEEAPVRNPSPIATRSAIVVLALLLMAQHGHSQ